MARVATAPRKLAIVGGYSDNDLYQRNRTLVGTIESLAQESLRIRPEPERSGHVFSAARPWWSRIGDLLGDARTIWRQRHRLQGVDTLFVPYPAYLDILWLWLLGQLRGRRVIADAFLELHGTVVEDRGLLPAGSLRARLLRALQRFSLSRADVVLIDTPEQAAQLRAELPAGIDVIPVPVGIDESAWSPLAMPEQRARARVLFWGTFIPLHGVDVIIEAARVLEQRAAPIDIRLIGDGQTAESCAQLLRRQPVATLSWERRLLDTGELRDEIAQADVVLGIFGLSQKAASVVPYKVHQALACNRPVVTRRSPAVDVALDGDAGFIGCAAGDPVALANAIESLWRRLQAGWEPTTRDVYERRYGNAVVRRHLAAALAPPARGT